MQAARALSRALPPRASGSPPTWPSVSCAPTAELAKAEAPYFKDIDLPVLTQTIATYQKLGNWTPHVEITRPAFEATLDIFKHAGLITRRHAYEDVVAPPPA